MKVVNRSERWQAARSLVVYYGSGRADQLRQYDVAIVEPAGQSAAVRGMKDAGTIVLGYLSVMEMPSGAAEQAVVTTDDYLYHQGSPVVNHEYGGSLMDLRSPRWRRLVLRRASAILAQGYDGLFLDTIADIEYPCWGWELRVGLIGAAAEMVERLRRAHGDCLLVQNNGAQQLIGQTYRYLDGVCLENASLDEVGRVLDYLSQLPRYQSATAPRLLLVSDHQGTSYDEYVTPDVLVYQAPPHYLSMPI